MPWNRSFASKFLHKDSSLHSNTCLLITFCHHHYLWHPVTAVTVDNYYLHFFRLALK